MAIRIQNHLKYYRERRAVSQDKLAKLAGINKRTISRIEREKTSTPYPDTRDKIAQALKISVHRIFPAVRV